MREAHARDQVELRSIQTRMAEVTSQRDGALRDAAQALSSKLSDRAQKKGASQQATAGIHEAVSAQKAIWAACSRILTAAAEEDSRIRQLLKETRRRRSAQ